MKHEAFERLSPEKQETIISAGIKEFAGKSYTEASTDNITLVSGISKGLLFHYFGSKKEFYLYCLSKSLDKLLEDSQADIVGGFYDILFAFMDKKFDQCVRFADEMHMVNMASRETCTAVAQGKARVMLKYRTAMAVISDRVMTAAVDALQVKLSDREKVKEGLQMYITAVIGKYLTRYQTQPDEFFRHREEIKTEFSEYLDLMLYGVTTDKN